MSLSVVFDRFEALIFAYTGYGWAGTYYFVDPETGIAAVYGTQVVPTCDAEVVQLWEELERALYAGISQESEIPCKSA